MLAARPLAVLATLLCAAPIVAQQTPAQQPPTPQPTFEVATIHIDGPDVHMTSISPRGALIYTVRGMSLSALIMRAYGIRSDQLKGLPAWNATTTYSVTAKPTGEKPFPEDQFKLALQQLLAQRFHLALHRTTRQVSGFALIVAKGKPKNLEPAQPGLSSSDGIQSDRDGFRVYNITMARLCSDALSFFLKTPVVDATNIPGSFKIHLQYNIDNTPDPPYPTIYTALEEQLGLKLVSSKGPVETLIIDHADREPSTN